MFIPVIYYIENIFQIIVLIWIPGLGDLLARIENRHQFELISLPTLNTHYSSLYCNDESEEKHIQYRNEYEYWKLIYLERILLGLINLI